jgi:hypothetical protein
VNMKNKVIAAVSLTLILGFIGFVIWDSITDPANKPDKTLNQEEQFEEMWRVIREVNIAEGQLTSVSVSSAGIVIVAGESFVSAYDSAMSRIWVTWMPVKINSLTVSGDTIYAAGNETINLLSISGKIIGEWGPYESESIITSVTAGKNYVAFADAGRKMAYVLKKDGELQRMVGQDGSHFIIPSPYFDVALDENDVLYTANTGYHRVEKWNDKGEVVSQFGEPGTAADAFAGCCNPAHFALIPQGVVTAEKGINRIKILDNNGQFIEYVSAVNNFTNSVPLDVASADGVIIYAAYPADSKLYIFKRKN